MNHQVAMSAIIANDAVDLNLTKKSQNILINDKIFLILTIGMKYN